MTSVEIKTFLELNKNRVLVEQIEEIFFLTTSKKDFNSPAERNNWFEKWLRFYIDEFPHLLLLAFNKNQLLGYLSGCDNIQEHWEQILLTHPYYEIFKDLISQFPAHFHINCHPRSQGMGVGSLLINSFLSLKEIQNGVHILTGPKAQNITFYLKNNFTFMQERSYKEQSILFMGRYL